MLDRRQLLHSAAIGLAAGVVVPARASGSAPVVEVEIVGYLFVPASLTVKRGTTVRWTNKERRTTHSVLFLGPTGFESERFFPGESWQRNFDKPGEYPYSCGPHPQMKGMIVVTE